jgi:predicted transcriptional regulator
MHTIERIHSIHELLTNTIAQVKQHAPKTYSKELVELLFEMPYSKIQFLVERMGIDRRTASKYLKNIAHLGILTPQRVGKEMIYINTQLIDILKKPL